MVVINELAGIGHNSGASLAEVLSEATVELRAYAARLLAGAQAAVVTDLDTATEATRLVRMMTEHGAKIEAARVERKAPYLDAARAIDLHFTSLRTSLVGPDAKKLGGAALRVKGLIDAFLAEEEAKAEVERRRLEEEARRKTEAAAAAERERLAAEEKARLATLQGDVRAALGQSGPRIDAELRQRQFEAEARRLSERASQMQVAPINTGLGVTARRQTNYKAEITNWKLALRHATKVNDAAFRDLVQQTYDRQVRAGVRSLPGANVVEDRQTIIRRA